MKADRNNRDEVQQIGEVLADILLVPMPTLGVDLDAPLESGPIFFKLLLSHWPGRIIGFSFDMEQAMAISKRLRLRCDEIIIAETAQSKGEGISHSGVMAMISHDAEALRYVSSDRVRLRFC